MIEKSPKLIWGLLALFIYGLLIGLLLFYFNTRNEIIPKHYVKKNEHRVQVSLSSQKEKREKISKPVVKPKVKPKVKVKKIKSKPKKQEKKKEIIKEKVVKKLAKKKVEDNITKKSKNKKVVKKPKIKKVVKKPERKKVKRKNIKKTSDLFSGVNTKNNHKEKDKSPSKSIKKNKVPSALEKISKSANASTNKDKGIENAYFSKVQSLLETWPAQSDFAGQKAMVRIYVKPTGQFDFKVKSKSNNVDFNLGLIDFLEQLQRLGLGSHNGGKTYEIEVEFTAKNS